MNLILFSILTFWFSHLVFSCFSLLEHFHFNLQVFKSALTIPFHFWTPYTMFSSMFSSVPFLRLGKCNLYVTFSSEFHLSKIIYGTKIEKKLGKLKKIALGKVTRGTSSVYKSASQVVYVLTFMVRATRPITLNVV